MPTHHSNTTHQLPKIIDGLGGITHDHGKIALGSHKNDPVSHKNAIQNDRNAVENDKNAHGKHKNDGDNDINATKTNKNEFFNL